MRYGNSDRRGSIPPTTIAEKEFSFREALDSKREETIHKKKSIRRPMSPSLGTSTQAIANPIQSSTPTEQKLRPAKQSFSNLPKPERSTSSTPSDLFLGLQRLRTDRIRASKKTLDLKTEKENWDTTLARETSLNEPSERLDTMDNSCTSKSKFFTMVTARRESHRHSHKKSTLPLPQLSLQFG